MYHSITLRCWLLLVVWMAPFASGEELFREAFDNEAGKSPLQHTWGDVPVSLESNSVTPKIGTDGTTAVRLAATFSDQAERKLSYWSYRLAESIPIFPQVQSVSFRVRTNVAVSIKIGISPFGFIYHGPGVGASPEWQSVTLDGAYEELRRWCAGGDQDASNGFVDSVIVAVHNQPGAQAEVIVDDISFQGPDGAVDALQAERFARRIRRHRIAAVSLTWDEGHRTRETTLAALDEAGHLGADLVCLPQECIDQPAEPIPGPSSEAIGTKAAEFGMYVVGNLREKEAGKTFISSFLYDRKGELVGKYRKSHRLPYEDDIDLGDELPVFKTDIGAIGLKIGTDHFFPEIDTVLRRRGASLVVWSTSPFPIRDEHYLTYALRGRAVQNNLCYVVARYAGNEGYGGYADRFSWTASWPLGRAQVVLRDGHTAADSGHVGGVAIASIPHAYLGGSPRAGGYESEGKFAAITAPELPPAPPRNEKRLIRAAAIECDTNIDRLLAKLDACGEQGCDIACLWEYVWYQTDDEVDEFRERNQQRLAQIAAAARRNQMYVVIGGELERGFNESIVFDRQGREMGRYTKIAQTTSKDSKYYREGDCVGIFDLDFGRICTKICLDVSRHEIDRVAGLYQADLMLLHTQDAGPYSEHILLRDHHRCIDNGYYLLRAAGGGTECDHRTYIMDPWGIVLAASQHGVNNPPVVATLDLNNRPKYFEWPEDVRREGVYPDPVKRGIPEDQRNKMYSRYNRPLAQGDLRAVVLPCRRPELYGVRGEK